MSGKLVLSSCFVLSLLQSRFCDLHRPGNVGVDFGDDIEISGVAWTCTVYCCGMQNVSERVTLSSEIVSFNRLIWNCET